MASDLAVAATYITEGFCPSCGGRLKGTRGHAWRSTRTVVTAHGECFTCCLCWVLFADNRIMMRTHEQINLSEMPPEAPDLILTVVGS